MDNAQLVNNIKSLCAKNDISVSQLEKILNLSNGLISRWKDKTPTLERLIDIAQFFNVSLDDLIGNTVEQSDDNTKISYLIRALYQETQNQKIKWGIVDIDNSSIKPLQMIYDIPDNNEFDYYYAMFKKGYFLIGWSNHESERKISLYVVPDCNSFPQLVCSNVDQLLTLFNLISNDLKKELNEIKTAKYIDDFLSGIPEILKSNSLDKFYNKNNIYKFG